MTRLSLFDAASILQRCKVPLGVDFFRLDSDQVAALIQAADSVRYRRPANANGSRARYFHAYLVRTLTGRAGRRTAAVLAHYNRKESKA